MDAPGSAELVTASVTLPVKLLLGAGLVTWANEFCIITNSIKPIVNFFINNSFMRVKKPEPLDQEGRRAAK